MSDQGDNKDAGKIGMIRPTPEDRLRFSEACPPYVCAAARALRDRFKELGIRPPFDEDDAAWADLADIAINSAVHGNQHEH